VRASLAEQLLGVTGLSYDVAAAFLEQPDQPFAQQDRVVRHQDTQTVVHVGTEG
jgi:hypothetical protein